MAELSLEELAKVLPPRLAQRIKNRINTEDPDFKLGTEIQEPITTHCPPETCHLKLETRYCNPKTNDQKLKIVLEIDQHRPDRIIFQGKEIKVTAKEFSLIHLLAQHPEQVMSYDELLDKLWKDEEDAIYSRINYHISKIRSTILKTIGESQINKEKVKDIFVVVHGRGIILKLKAEELKINQYNNRNCGKKLPAVAVDKLKEKGEEKMKAIREQLLSLDFKESFIEKLLKDYPAEKIKENLELLLEKKNINRPAGWLMAP